MHDEVMIRNRVANEESLKMQHNVYIWCALLGAVFMCAASWFCGRESHISAAHQITGRSSTAETLTAALAASAKITNTRVMLLRHADIARKFGDYSTAELIVKQLLDDNKGSFHPDDAELAIGLTKLGQLCVDQGKYAEAKAYYQRVLAIVDNDHGHERAANLLQPHLQADSAETDQFHFESEVVHHRLLAFLARRLGHEDPMVAIVLRDLAEFYHRRGGFTDAALYYDYALAILRANFGADHPEYQFANERRGAMQRELESKPSIDANL